MTSKNTTQNLKSISSEALDWAVVQKDMKNKLDGLYGIHSAKLPYAQDGFYALEEKERTMQIKSSVKANNFNLHPIVREHFETKSQSLFINPIYTIGIDGMSDIDAYIL